MHSNVGNYSHVLIFFLLLFLYFWTSEPKDDDGVLIFSPYSNKLGGFDSRLPENVEYLEELKRLAETEGVSNQVKFITSCPTMERNALLSQCICVIYTPKVTC